MANLKYFIDSHCHLHDQEFFSPEEQNAALARALLNHIEKIVCIGTDHQDSFDAQKFVLQHPEFKLFWSYGIHPSEYAKARGESTEFSKCPPVAIGEVGLDYHYGQTDREAQIRLFEEMLDLAVTYNLPLIFHVREAFDDFFAILKNRESCCLRGVVHSFTDNKKNLKKSLDTGFYIGLNGIATYSTLPTPPLDRILLETDAPFLAPSPHRGETNEPSFIKDIAHWLAQKLQLTITEVTAATFKNAEKLFKI